MNKLQAALGYAAHGLAVFPLKARDKVPATAHGVKDATRDPEQIRRWWEANPDYNIGIATGKPSGVVVLDVDGATGDKSMEELGASLPLTPAVRTGKGHHIYFRQPDAELGNRAGMAPGLDFRADGGYVVAPPSEHPDGRVYEWEVDWLTPFAAIPADWLALAQRPVVHETSTEVITEGRRNDTAFRDASAMRRRGLGVEAIYAALKADPRYSPPLPDAEVREIAESVARTYQPDAEAAANEEWKERQAAKRVASEHTVVASAMSLDGVLWSQELRETADEPITYLPLMGAEGFFVQGDSHLLVAYPKVGKTELQGWLAREWADDHAVLYFTEESERTWKRRLKRQAPRTARNFAVIPTRGQSHDWMMGKVAAVLQRMVENGAKPPYPPVVVIDTIRLLGIEDENDPAKAEKAMLPWVTFSQSTGCTVVLVHHARKGGDKQSIESAAGSHAFVGAVDNILMVDRVGDRDSTRRSVNASGRSIEGKEGVYDRREHTVNGFGTGTYDFEYIGEHHAVPVKDRVKPLLLQEWQTALEIRTAMEEPKPTKDAVSDALTALAYDGVAERKPAIGEDAERRTVKWRLRLRR